MNGKSGNQSADIQASNQDSPQQFNQSYKDQKSLKKPTYIGHRQRLRERFVQSDLDYYPDYDLLELALSYLIPRVDVKPLARHLMDHFGGFGRVLHAPVQELVKIKGCKESTAIGIRMLRAVAHRLTKESLEEKPVMDNFDAIIRYLRASMSHEAIEHIKVLLLDTQFQLLHDKVLQQGTIDRAAIYPREIVKLCLDHHAANIILVHNHPSGDTKPSGADLAMTEALQKALSVIEVTMVDHIIIGSKSHTSLRALGFV